MDAWATDAQWADSMKRKRKTVILLALTVFITALVVVSMRGKVRRTMVVFWSILECMVHRIMSTEA